MSNQHMNLRTYYAKYAWHIHTCIQYIHIYNIVQWYVQNIHGIYNACIHQYMYVVVYTYIKQLSSITYMYIYTYIWCHLSHSAYTHKYTSHYIHVLVHVHIHVHIHTVLFITYYIHVVIHINIHPMSLIIFTGVLQADPGVIREHEHIYRLFCHECQRVFHDRLIDKTDKKYFYDILSEMSSKHFSKVTTYMYNVYIIPVYSKKHLCG